MSEHTNSMLRVQAAQLSAQLKEAVGERNRLTTENAKLREQLAEAVELLKKCTSPYSTAADRLRALDAAGAWAHNTQDTNNDAP